MTDCDTTNVFIHSIWHVTQHINKIEEIVISNLNHKHWKRKERVHSECLSCHSKQYCVHQQTFQKEIATFNLQQRQAKWPCTSNKRRSNSSSEFDGEDNKWQHNMHGEHSFLRLPRPTLIDRCASQSSKCVPNVCAQPQATTIFSATIGEGPIPATMELVPWWACC